jgi:hypothetical protein
MDLGFDTLLARFADRRELDIGALCQSAAVAESGLRTVFDRSAPLGHRHYLENPAPGALFLVGTGRYWSASTYGWWARAASS